MRSLPLFYASNGQKDGKKQSPRALGLSSPDFLLAFVQGGIPHCVSARSSRKHHTSVIFLTVLCLSFSTWTIGRKIISLHSVVGKIK